MAGSCASDLRKERVAACLRSAHRHAAKITLLNKLYKRCRIAVRLVPTEPAGSQPGTPARATRPGNRRGARPRKATAAMPGTIFFGGGRGRRTERANPDCYITARSPRRTRPHRIGPVRKPARLARSRPPRTFFLSPPEY